MSTAPAPAPALEALGLAKHYPIRQGWHRPPRTVRALDDVSFVLPPGRTLAVVGESGCGKTTLARQLTLIERPSAGTLRIGGASPGDDEASLRRLRRRIQMVFQNPFASLNPRKTVSAILEEPLTIAGELDAAARGERVLELLGRVGLSAEQARRYPHMFSGGQRQRIAIARAMALEPAVIVADEPVSALDVSIQAQVLNLFMDLQERHGTAYVFVSHDLAVVEHMAHEVLVMYLGRTVELAPAAALFAAPAHPYTRALLATRPRLDARVRRTVVPIRGEPPSPLDPPAGCAFHPRCPEAVPRCRDERPALRALGDRRVACHLA
ncbi:MAG: dipeptide ABC transporter ATP-binding protein [Burkholderiaceae bacterium]|nr:dipeptide ABC transporter ATP-binding protein [Burkholderiales bacterium]MCZ8338392.1 dipeptide ABC transporter ATP-binding protein [Burkholderiaceae bacterium]